MDLTVWPFFVKPVHGINWNGQSQNVLKVRHSSSTFLHVFCTLFDTYFDTCFGTLRDPFFDPFFDPFWEGLKMDILRLSVDSGSSHLAWSLNTHFCHFWMVLKRRVKNTYFPTHEWQITVHVKHVYCISESGTLRFPLHENTNANRVALHDTFWYPKTVNFTTRPSDPSPMMWPPQWAPVDE